MAESNANVFDAASGKVTTRTVDLADLGDGTRRRLLRAAVLRYQGNRRQGTHSTLTRAEVSRTGRKPYRQKGTGRARAGDFKSPIWRGGGVVFGPKPRSYRTGMPVKARREALRSALLARFEAGDVRFFSGISWNKPSTKAAAQGLAELGCTGSTVVVTGDPDPIVYRSFRNLARVQVVPAQDVNALHLLQPAHVVFVGEALDVVRGRLTQRRSDSEAASVEESSDA